MTTKALAVVTELDRYIAEVSRYPLLSAEQEMELARRWRDEQDVSAAHTLVTANLRFVVKIANEYKGYGARVLDLVQEGSVGLMQAVKKFDPDRGYRLLTYAVYWIRSHIHSYLMRTSRMIKIGTSRAHRKLFFKLRSIKGQLAAKGMEKNSEILDAVAQHTGVSKDEVIAMDQHLSGKDTSLETPVGESGTTLREMIPYEAPNPEDLVGDLEAEADLSAKLETALSALDEREKEIIQKRFLTDEPVQLKDIGERMGITKQRVAQLEKRALRKLKDHLQIAA